MPSGARDCAVRSATNDLDEGLDTDYVRALRPIGAVSAVVLFVAFPDAPAQTSTQASLDLLGEGADWLSTSSYGRVTVGLAPHQEWLRMPSPSTDYAYDRGLSYADRVQYITDAVNAADSDVDFSQHDIVYVVANREATAISFFPAYVAGGWLDLGPRAGPVRLAQVEARLARRRTGHLRRTRQSGRRPARLAGGHGRERAGGRADEPHHGVRGGVTQGAGPRRGRRERRGGPLPHRLLPHRRPRWDHRHRLDPRECPAVRSPPPGRRRMAGGSGVHRPGGRRDDRGGRLGRRLGHRPDLRRPAGT